MRAVVLDNEAVVVLRNPAHPMHRQVVAHLQATVSRSRRKTAVTVVVATAVRVEAGWDRSKPGAAAINRFRVEDFALDRAAANVAAGIVMETGVSVPDAHTGAAIRSLEAIDIVVLTSDPGDMRRVADPVPVRAIRI